MKDEVKICARCSNPFWVTRNRKYCPDCSVIVHREQKNEIQIERRTKQHFPCRGGNADAIMREIKREV